ncbi:MAG: zf-HC2 domain-containing protein [Acidobacteria bacterium]|nr:zf-HC2 domain-containing protein [Acidobacteriota bacterium]
MICPDDFTLSQYADGELPEDEAGKLAAHFEVCAVCRKRALAFEAETRLLAESLQEIELWEPEPETVRRKIPGTAWISRLAFPLFAIAVLLRSGIDFILDKELPPVLDWLHPFSLSGFLNLIATGFFYFLEKGRGIMTALVNEVSAAVLSLLILGLLVVMIRRTRIITAAISLSAMLLVAIVPGHAVEIRKPQKEEGILGSVSIPAGETIDDSLVVFADSVDVRGTVTGDLITFARRINVAGAVQGNVITFGQNVDVRGKVDGDIIGFAQTIRADGEVGKNLWAFAQNIAIDPDGKLGQNATMFATYITVDGNVGKDITAFGAFHDISGTVGRDLNIRGERLSVHDTSVIGRDLNAWVKLEKNVQIDPSATIQGATKVELMKKEEGASRYMKIGFYFRQLLRIVGAFLAGLLLFWLLPGLKRAPLSSGRGLLASGGIGFLAAVATPIAGVILAITVIGLPLALVTLAFWLLALYLSKIVIGRYIGSTLLGNGNDTVGSTALSLLIGITIIVVAINLPFIGGILNILLMLIGLGAFLITAYRMFRGRNETEQIQESAS